MKVKEVILRAMAKKITWWPAAEISDRSMRRWRERYEEHGYEKLQEENGIELSYTWVKTACKELGW
jgi:hypothetical protein